MPIHCTMFILFTVSYSNLLYDVIYSDCSLYILLPYSMSIYCTISYTMLIHCTFCYTYVIYTLYTMPIYYTFCDIRYTIKIPIHCTLYHISCSFTEYSFINNIYNAPLLHETICHAHF